MSDAQFSALSAKVDGLGTRVDNLSVSMNELDNVLSGGIAASMALGSAIAVPDKAFSLSLNVATYGGEQGFAGTMTGRLSDSVYVSAGVAGNSGGRGRVGAQAGVALGF